MPLDVVEKGTIKDLIDDGKVVIAAGGGGVPVMRLSDGTLAGVDAVIDKDRASALLANLIGADELCILTGVEKVAINFKKPDQRYFDALTVAECERYLAEGQFPKGSMGPKIEQNTSHTRKEIQANLIESTISVTGPGAGNSP